MEKEIKSTPVSGKDRVKKVRAAKRKAGLVPVEVWVQKDRKDELKTIEKELQKPLK